MSSSSDEEVLASKKGLRLESSASEDSLSPASTEEDVPLKRVPAKKQVKSDSEEDSDEDTVPLAKKVDLISPVSTNSRQKVQRKLAEEHEEDKSAQKRKENKSLPKKSTGGKKKKVEESSDVSSASSSESDIESSGSEQTESEEESDEPLAKKKSAKFTKGPAKKSAPNKQLKKMKTAADEDSFDVPLAKIVATKNKPSRVENKKHKGGSKDKIIKDIDEAEASSVSISEKDSDETLAKKNPIKSKVVAKSNVNKSKDGGNLRKPVKNKASNGKGGNKKETTENSGSDSSEAEDEPESKASSASGDSGSEKPLKKKRLSEEAGKVAAGKTKTSKKVPKKSGEKKKVERDHDISSSSSSDSDEPLAEKMPRQQLKKEVKKIEIEEDSCDMPLTKFVSDKKSVSESVSDEEAAKRVIPKIETTAESDDDNSDEPLAQKKSDSHKTLAKVKGGDKKPVRPKKVAIRKPIESDSSSQDSSDVPLSKVAVKDKIADKVTESEHEVEPEKMASQVADKPGAMDVDSSSSSSSSDSETEEQASKIGKSSPVKKSFQDDDDTSDTSIDDDAEPVVKKSAEKPKPIEVPKSRKRKQSDAENGGSAAKSKKSRKSGDAAGDGEAEEGKSHLDQLIKIAGACGIACITITRKLKGIDSLKTKIKTVKKFLEDEGMEGRPSMEKAEKVRLLREVRELGGGDLDIDDLCKENGKGRTRATRSTRPLVARQRESPKENATVKKKKKAVLDSDPENCEDENEEDGSRSSTPINARLADIVDVGSP